MGSDVEALVTHHRLTSRLVGGPMDYALVEPSGSLSSGAARPLLMLLHGGDGGQGFAERMAPLIGRAWGSGILRPLTVAVPITGRSLFMDFRDGSYRWERLLTGPFLDRLAKHHAVTSAPEQRVVCGISMGGMGAMRIALKRPDVFAGAAALCPGVEAALEFDEIALRDRFGRSQDFYETIFGSPVDREYWRANNPASLAVDRAEMVRTSGIQLLLECGNADSFMLQYGTEFLHRCLFDHGIAHEYRLIDRAEHIGPSLEPRFAYAFAFLDKVLDGETEQITPEVAELRKRVQRLKEAAGYVD